MGAVELLYVCFVNFDIITNLDNYDGACANEQKTTMILQEKCNAGVEWNGFLMDLLGLESR